MSEAKRRLEDGENSGFIEKPPTPTDYFAGHPSSKIFYEVRLKSGDWREYRPSVERQKFKYFDSMSCVSFSVCNLLETQLNFLLAFGLVPKHIVNLLNVEGYIDANGKVNFSDRFLSKMSNTTKNGNSLQNVWDTARHVGLLPEKDWTWNDEFNWDSYFSSILQALKDKAKRIFGEDSPYFNIQYEWVIARNSAASQTISYTKVDKEFKQAPLQFASATCPGWSDGGIIKKCNLGPSHAYQADNLDDQTRWTDIFDTYEPFGKRLAPDYNVAYIMKGLLSIKTYEITTGQSQFVWLKRNDLKLAFPASNKFVSPKDSNDNIYEWIKNYGVYEEPEIFQKKIMDWNSLKVSSKEREEVKGIEVSQVKKKTFGKK